MHNIVCLFWKKKKKLSHISTSFFLTNKYIIISHVSLFYLKNEI